MPKTWGTRSPRSSASAGGEISSSASRCSARFKFKIAQTIDSAISVDVLLVNSLRLKVSEACLVKHGWAWAAG